MVGGGSGWGTRVRPWWIDADVWQNEYNIVKNQPSIKINKFKFKKKFKKVQLQLYIYMGKSESESLSYTIHKN